jgi:uncharacterized protein (DUF4415 family)
MTREEVIEAMKTPPPGGYYVWDGEDEDDRPLTKEEMRAGIELARKRGRPVGSNKEQVAIRFDKDVLAALRATGRGWQTRVNDVMREWVQTHTP